MHIAVITARGGSKRLPGKNIRSFCGRPMLAWPIRAARASGCFEHILVSTDDEKIAIAAKEAGAEVPFLRPVDMADDMTPAHKAARHMLLWAIKKWGDIPAFAHIYPTAPFLTPEVIRTGEECIEHGASFVYTARRLDFPLYQIVLRNEDGSLRPLFPPELAAMRSQDMPEAFMDAGQLYWFNTKAFLAKELEIEDGARLIVLPPEYALDIDTQSDWIFAEKVAACTGFH